MSRSPSVALSGPWLLAHEPFCDHAIRKGVLADWWAR